MGPGTLTVVVPEYVAERLGDKARPKRCTVRYLVLRALKDSELDTDDIKLDIEDVDLQPDGRRVVRA